jgi:hypothetical protein
LSGLDLDWDLVAAGSLAFGFGDLSAFWLLA